MCASRHAGKIVWALPILLLLTFVLGPQSASAHHSRHEYDRREQLSISGTVKEFRLVNPHAWIDVTVETTDGETENWSFEGDSVARLARAGWDAELLRPGDHVTVLYNPRRDGAPGGVFRGITTAEGKYYPASRRRLNLRFGGGSQ